MSEKQNPLYWYLCCAGMVLLTVLTFTPLVVPVGEYEPMVLGMPLTLWAGMLIALLMVVLIYVGTQVYPGTEEEEEGA
jgi:hypothetical protein